MEPSDVQNHLLQTLSLRIGDEMARYILRHDPITTPLPVIAHDARTGLPLATVLSADDLSLTGHFRP